jgi:AcrR family transcriptional regulator
VAPSDTRTKILQVAERLYAERGIEGVSLREIGAAAGQRNTAAVHYHFGGREGLVRALFEHRYERLEARRAAMLAELDARTEPAAVRELVAVLVLPFVEHPDGSGHWVRFVARLHEDPRYNPFGQIAAVPYSARAEAVAASQDASARIARSIGLDEPERVARMFLVTTMVVHAVADREALLAAGAAGALTPDDAFARGVVDAATAILTAPVPRRSSTAVPRRSPSRRTPGSRASP